MNPSSVNTIKELTGVYGNAIIATLVLAVVVLFGMLVWSLNSRLSEARELGSAATKLSAVIEANTVTLQKAVETLGEASDALRIAFQLVGKYRRRESAPSTPKGGVG